MASANLQSALDNLEAELERTAQRVQADVDKHNQQIADLRAQVQSQGAVPPDVETRLQALTDKLAAIDPNDPTTLADVGASTTDTGTPTPPATPPPATGTPSAPTT